MPFVVPAVVTVDGVGALPKIANEFHIAEDLGVVSGTNLFHSFGAFSLAAGEAARFTGPSPVTDIFARVTGGNVSVINGTINSLAYPSANFYLINPSGVMFGAASSLEVGGAFYASTADYIRFADGFLFDQGVALSGGILSAEPPEAFGFLSGNPAGISVEGANLAPNGSALALVGGNVEISGSSISTPGGHVELAAVASAGEVLVGPGAGVPYLDPHGFDHLGDVRLTSSTLDASGPGGGSVVIRGGRVLMDGADVLSNITDDTPAGHVGGVGVDIHAETELALENVSRIASNVVQSATEDAPGVRIKAGHLEVRDCIGASCSFIQSAVSPGTPGGNGGDVQISAVSVALHDGGTIQAFTGGAGSSGDILIDAESVLVSTSGPFTAIRSLTFNGGSGAAGDVRVTTSDLDILSASGAFSEISSLSFFSFGAGAGGSVFILPRGGLLDVLVSGGGPTESGIFANAFGTGPGGDVVIGSLDDPASRVRIEERSGVLAKGFFTGAGGDIHLSSERLELVDGGQLNTNTLGFFGFGPAPAGDIHVHSNELLISGFDGADDPFGFDATGMFSGAVNGSGGIHVTAIDRMTLTNRAQISASTLGPGSGGLIEVNAGTLRLLRGSSFLNNTLSSGDGGEVRISASSILVSGSHPQPFNDPTAGVSVARSGIASQTAGTGDAGDIRIVSDSLRVADGARVTSETFGPGDGGIIDIRAGHVVVDGIDPIAESFELDQGRDRAQAARNASAAIIASTSPSFGASTGGAGGVVRIRSQSLSLRDGGKILSSTRGNGPGGDVVIVSGATTLSGEVEIAADSTGSGEAGNVALRGESARLAGGALITASTSDSGRGGNIDIDLSGEMRVEGSARPGVPSAVRTESTSPLADAGDAGRIRIAASDLTVADGAQISTRSASADGGDIKLDVASILLLDHGQIVTSVGTGEGSGGNIDIDPVFVILFASKIQANAFGGRGGNIRIVTSFLFADRASVIEASSAKSIDGTVEIVSPDSDITSTLALLPSEYLDAASQLAQRCSARRGQLRASLAYQGRAGLRPRPGAPMPSYYAVAPEVGARAGGAHSPVSRGAAGAPLSALPVWLECSA